MLSTYSATAQTNLPALNTVDGLPLRDLTGLVLPNAIGSRFTVDLPDGTRCSSEDGTPTTLNFYVVFLNGKTRLIIPLLPVRLCMAAAVMRWVKFYQSHYPLRISEIAKAYSISILNKKLELATLLHEEGLLSDEDLSEFLAKVKKVILTE